METKKKTLRLFIIILISFILPSAAQAQTVISGALEVTDPTFNHPASGAICIPTGTSVYYDAYTYSHTGGPLSIEMTAGTMTDPFLALYSGSFDPLNPCTNFVAANDDSITGLDSKLVLNLPAGTYVIVATSSANGDTGTYDLTIFTPSTTTWRVNTTVDEMDFSCSDGDCSLRDAIMLANPGDEIIIPAGTYTLRMGDLSIAKTLTLTGAGAETTIIQAASEPNIASWRVFFIGSYGLASVDISGLTIRHGNIPDDVFAGGGGIANYGQKVTLRNCAVAYNSSYLYAGGIFNEGVMTITDSAIYGNTGMFYGGGIVNFGVMTINNSTVSGNLATPDFFVASYGGGILNYNSSYNFLKMNNCTVAGNFSWVAGGIANMGGIAIISNSIIAGNHALITAPDCGGTFTSGGNNLIGDGTQSTGFVNGVTGDLVGDAASPIDPMLGPLADNGGPTWTHALLLGSPAIDAGNPATCEATDQRGVTRPWGAACDMGAYEFIPSDAVYRFWSPVFSSHFFTISEAERDYIIANWPGIWTYEGVAFRAFQTQEPGTMPVYRFWSPVDEAHFYTISEAERDYIIANWPGIWTYEGIAFYAYPAQAPVSMAVYRFLSAFNQAHFYTISEAERDYIIATWPDIWTYEGVAFYAYPNP
jgi:CSLREA domain-containing protein